MPGIVVGVDASAHAHDALDWAVREAATRHTPLTVLTIVPAMVNPWTKHPLTVPNAQDAVSQARHSTEEAVTKSVSAAGDAQPPSITVQVSTGFPSQALIDASREAELVVVGSRGAGGFAALLLGSVSSQLAHYAACPVVIVPSGPRHEHRSQESGTPPA